MGNVPLVVLMLLKLLLSSGKMEMIEHQQITEIQPSVFIYFLTICLLYCPTKCYNYSKPVLAGFFLSLPQFSLDIQQLMCFLNALQITACAEQCLLAEQF